MAAGPASLLLLHPSPVSLKAALRGGHAGCPQRGRGKCPTLPTPGLGWEDVSREDQGALPPPRPPGLGTLGQECAELADGARGLNLW